MTPEYTALIVLKNRITRLERIIADQKLALDWYVKEYGAESDFEILKEREEF